MSVEGATAMPSSARPSVRLATVTVNGFLGCLWLVAATRVVRYAGWSWQAVAGCAYLGVLVGLQVRYIGVLRGESTRARVAAVLLVQAALVYLPVLHFSWWLGLPGILAGNVLLVLPWRLSVPLFVLVVGSFSGVQAELEDWTFTAIYGPLTTVMTGFAVYGLGRLASLVRDVEDARGELARARVADERLRFADDLQEFLGKRLSGIAVQADRTVELLHTSSERAADELKEILVVSRRALAEVRAVSSGYRHASLRQELDSARSVLEAAEIVVRCEIDDAELDGAHAALVATALREAVTNVLRHSAAGECVIALHRVDGQLRLDVRNDGAGPAADGDAAEADDEASGLESLAERVAGTGGTVRVTRTGDMYRLTVTVPADGGDAGGQRGADLVPAMSRRLATTMVTGVFACYAGVALTSLILVHATVWRTAAGAVFLLLMVVLQIGFVMRRRTRQRAAWRVPVLAAQAALVFAPALMLGQWWAPSLAGFLTGSILFLCRPPVAAPLVAAELAAVGWLAATFSEDPILVVGIVFDVAGVGLMVYGLTRLARLVGELHSARAELARLAVARVRLRFARDVHDLLGLGLSAITLKAEVANKVLVQHPERASEQLAEIAELARKSLGDMRAIISGYQELSLDDELASARSVLASADVDLVIDLDARVAVAEREPVLALVAREGVTNVLRHSKATRCEISLRELEGQLQLDIRNDGVVAGGVVADDGGGGSGMSNLSQRVHEVGGVLRFGATEDGMYQLRVRIPPIDSTPERSAVR